MGWVYHEFTVQSTTPLTALRFVSLTGTLCGPTLDDVSVRLISRDDDDDDDDGPAFRSGRQLDR